MTALLTNNLPLLAGAPNGIKKLRELILELAVRGKLVPQDPSDEPASELLKRIAEDKARLTAGKKLKQQAEISSQEQPFPVPQGWNWVRLGSCLEMINGRAFKPTEWIAAGLPIVRIQNLNKPEAPFNYCNPDTVDDRHVIDTGTILISWSGTPGTSFGAFIWERGKAALNQHIFSCSQVGDAFFDKFLKLAINTRLEELIAKAHGGVGLQHVTKGKLEALTLVLPPIAEQHRIVAKVDELMAFCDRLDAQQADAENAHAQLLQALLDSLIQTCDANQFAANWQRLAKHFHTLFTTESSIGALKQTVLQLAVMGKLVPQNSSDEPVACLLEKNGIKSQPHMLQGWAQAPLGQLGEIIGGSTPSKANAEFWSGDIPWVSPKDMKRPLIQDSEDHISAKALAETSLRSVPPKSLLMVVRGMILAHSFPVAITAREVTINQDMKALVPPAEISDYLLMYLQAAKGLMVGLVDRSSHGTCKLISEKLWSHIVSLPPLDEQHRIVKKVAQLMTLCDQLKARLTQAHQLNEQLANTLVEHAISEDCRQASISADRQVARTLLAAEITHRLHNQRTFGQRKLQKVIYLAEHAAKLTAIQGAYLRDAAGPHDRQLMNQIESELRNRQWYERIERETVGHSYRPLSQAGEHRQAYRGNWSVAERITVDQVIELMQGWDTDRCEMTVTLYAAWNDFILEGRPVADEAIVNEVMHNWNVTKLRFCKTEWFAVLAEMKKHKVLMPTGFGKRTEGGMRSLPGFE
ncbi:MULTISPECIES: restriction endonuclease subunit S [unclassified Pseudomonas]|uniref:restriction endonuclease subunit S n=1 Tax=unclassified Pseudomonas TaxID=196821 RepID=UPI000A1ED161|nr:MULTISPECIES: restriction endonuclease subunit S [unclassified Pseudomonas]